MRTDDDLGDHGAMGSASRAVARYGSTQAQRGVAALPE